MQINPSSIPQTPVVRDTRKITDTPRVKNAVLFAADCLSSGALPNEEITYSPRNVSFSLVILIQKKLSYQQNFQHFASHFVLADMDRSTNNSKLTWCPAAKKGEIWI